MEDSKGIVSLRSSKNGKLFSTILNRAMLMSFFLTYDYTTNRASRLQESHVLHYLPRIGETLESVLAKIQKNVDYLENNL
jgi:hypothetical protein